MKLTFSLMLIFYVFSSFVAIQATKKIDVDELRCLVCRVSLDEINKVVNNIDPTKRVDVGGYRLDSNGNIQYKSIAQAKSEIHLSEVIDEVCNRLDDYVRATWKKNGTLTLLKLISDNGKMNSDMSEVDLIQDDDLNKSLKYYCEGIMEEFEENIIKHLQNESEDIHSKVCIEESSICRLKLGPKERVSDEL